jgi:hypothetical protein
MRTRRAVAVSAFCCFHAAAILWWNVVTMRPPDPSAQQASGVSEAWAKGRERVRGSAVGHVLDRALSGYVRATTTWQNWYLFAPDPPLYAPRIQIYGIRRVREGVEMDPRPLFELDDVDLDDQRLLLARPPCGFEVSDDPRAIYLRGAWTRHVLRERVHAVGYVGARTVCRLWALPMPSEERGAFAGTPEDLVLWEGPL